MYNNEEWEDYLPQSSRFKTPDQITEKNKIKLGVIKRYMKKWKDLYKSMPTATSLFKQDKKIFKEYLNELELLEETITTFCGELTPEKVIKRMLVRLDEYGQLSSEESLLYQDLVKLLQDLQEIQKSK